MDQNTKDCIEHFMGLAALAMINVMAFVFDSEWKYVAMGLDIAVVGAYLKVTIQSPPQNTTTTTITATTQENKPPEVK